MKGQSPFNARGKATLLLGSKEEQNQNGKFPMKKKRVSKKHMKTKTEASTKDNNKSTKNWVRKQQNYKVIKQLQRTT